MNKILLMLTVAIVIVACKSNDKNASTGENIKDSATLTNNPQTAENNKDTLTPDANWVDEKSTTIKWLDSTYLDMGSMKKGEVMNIKFRFKNTGNNPLVIENVTAGCGCTVPEKPTKPYAPGESDVIKAKFDSQSQQAGEHRKQVTVVANTKPVSIHSLTFRVEVKE